MTMLVFRARAAVDQAPALEIGKALSPYFTGQTPPPCFHDHALLLLIAAMHGVLNIASAYTALLIKYGRDAKPPREDFFALWRALDRARDMPATRRIAS